MSVYLHGAEQAVNMKESRVLLKRLMTDSAFLANEHLKNSKNTLILPKIA